MKKYIIIITVLFISTISFGQNINWEKESNTDAHIMVAGFGYDYGATANIGVYKHFNFLNGLIIGGELSMPMGSQIMDDFKTRFGGSILLLETESFKISGLAYANIRRYENPASRMWSFGSEFGLVFGYYKSKWHLAGEILFDKAVTTHLKNKDVMKEVYPDVQDGWLLPAGGNWAFGIQASRSLNNNLDLGIKLGTTMAEQKDENAVLPVYFRVELIKRF